MDLGYCQLKGEVAGLPALGQVQDRKLHHGAEIFPNGATAWKSAETFTWQNNKHL